MKPADGRQRVGIEDVTPQVDSGRHPLITTLNRIRRENRALQSNASLHFHFIDNPNLMCYSKSTPGFENTILVAVNIDSFNEQTGWTNLDLDRIGVSANGSFLVEDMLNGKR